LGFPEFTITSAPLPCQKDLPKRIKGRKKTKQNKTKKAQRVSQHGRSKVFPGHMAQVQTCFTSAKDTRPLEQGCSFHYAHTALHNQASKCCDDLLTPTSCIDILSTSNALFLDTPSSHIGTPQIPAH